MTTTFHRLSAFADGDGGGNPAGVLIADRMAAPAAMQALAADVGYSETAFLAPEGAAWRTRYFAPEIEVPFCGHATIAAAATLGSLHGAGRYDLALNGGPITVEAFEKDGRWGATLTSPPTSHRAANGEVLEPVFSAFALSRSDLAGTFQPTVASAGANHLLLPLKDQASLVAMTDDFEAMRAHMAAHDITTIALIWQESLTLFHARNAFAIGGVVEDPATGAAAAALGGFLRDAGIGASQTFTIIQGETMGMRSVLSVDATGEPGSGVRVSGFVRALDGDAPASLTAFE